MAPLEIAKLGFDALIVIERVKGKNVQRVEEK